MESKPTTRTTGQGLRHSRLATTCSYLHDRRRVLCNSDDIFSCGSFDLSWSLYISTFQFFDHGRHAHTNGIARHSSLNLPPHRRVRQLLCTYLYASWLETRQPAVLCGNMDRQHNLAPPTVFPKFCWQTLRLSGSTPINLTMLVTDQILNPTLASKLDKLPYYYWPAW
ncbi:hypothetical protein M422DRAFT_35832 [Sphaerobolus stellatus SS14]|uniref:Unplaced genomic scaffold SPHSTscaffold_152, whole genome shotgun sequence n=1 Tax=Sphaerobolus stellatus (strain SS14) TaxID=990650 RepID=A0A0C9V4V2_SPHS4|nr:hypothetical protein M422DRAFT_35832 [Sphaerobolus stellatus SS14]